MDIHTKPEAPIAKFCENCNRVVTKLSDRKKQVIKSRFGRAILAGI